MTEEKSLSERMADLEDKLDYLIYSGKPKYEPELSESSFRTFYNKFVNKVEDIGALGGRITINSRFENILKHKVLYPDYEKGYWYPVGVSSHGIPIDFAEMRHDFCVEIIDAGDFPTSDNNVRGLK